MKKMFCAIFLSVMFLANLTYAQDMIILKTGDEIKSKVLEITPDLVKYKKWENQEGPAYSANKSDIFMIKYANGTKDVFNNVLAVNSNTNQISSISGGSKFLGTWYYKKYNGNGNRTLINITKAVDNFLVEYKVHEDVGNNFYNADGSFKEVGHLENGSIVINSFIKLSLLNENTLLMNSSEFYRMPLNSQNQSSNTSSSNINSNTTNTNGSNNIQNQPSSYEERKSLKTSHIGHFNNEIKNDEYLTQYVTEKSPSIIKNLFYRGENITLSQAKFGAFEKYKEDKLIVKKGDTLSLNILCLRFKDRGKEWDGKKTEYLLSVQIEDNTGKEYFLETFDQALNIRKSDSPLVSIAKYDIDVPIVIDPKKMLLLPIGKDLYLSILVKGKTEKKSIWEGFVKFEIE